MQGWNFEAPMGVSRNRLLGVAYAIKRSLHTKCHARMCDGLARALLGLINICFVFIKVCD